jgi:hypothetical protein
MRSSFVHSGYRELDAPSQRQSLSVHGKHLCWYGQHSQSKSLASPAAVEHCNDWVQAMHTAEESADMVSSAGDNSRRGHSV